MGFARLPSVNGRSLPTGVVTFVVTDLAGSRRLWDRDPAAMEQALARHDHVLARVIERHGGFLLKRRGEGDSTFSVFERASDAVRAAYDAQVELTSNKWPTALRARCRIAVHAGEASPTDGDYFGAAVHAAERLRSDAAGGEVVVSHAVAALVADHLPSEWKLVRRSHEAFALGGPLLDPPGRRRGEPPSDLLATRGVTRRERDVLDAIAERLTNAEIADRFSVSERTIETHVTALLRKLEVTNRVELAHLAHGLEQAAQPPEIPAMLLRSARRSRCIGRDDERTTLLDCWERAARGETLLAVVCGEAGVGKSRLVADLAVEAHERGARVLLGSAHDGAPAPYQPLVEALTPIVDAATESQLRADSGLDVQVLSRLFPSMSKRLGSIPVETTEHGAFGDTYEVQAALASFIARGARRRPTLLVIEDLHWASHVTRQSVLQAARGGGNASLLIVVTARNTAPDLDDALTSFLAVAARVPECEIVTLGGLDIDATRTLVTELGGRIDADEAHRQTGGNPLLLREMTVADATSPTLHDLLADRYALLVDDDLDVVDTAAVLGESFGADIVAAATRRPIDQVLDALEHGRAAGLIETVGDADRTYAFTHALFRSHRYDALSAGRRMRLHAAVVEALLPRADDPTIVHDLARHACIAAPLSDAERAVEFARQAGAASAREGDVFEAIHHYRRALDVIDLADRPDESVRLQLDIRLGEAVVGVDKEDGLTILRDAARLARRLGDIDALADAVCSMSPWGGSLALGEEDPVFVALGEEALALLPDRTAWRARLLAVLGVHLVLGLHQQRGEALVLEALERSDELDDPALRLQCITAMSYVRRPGLEVGSLLEEQFAISERRGDRGVAHQAAFGLANHARERGDLDTMGKWHERARELRLAHPSPNELQDATLTAILDGDLELAERCNRRTAEIMSSLGANSAAVYSGSAHVTIRLWRGILPRTTSLEVMAALPNFFGHSARAMLALVHSYAGRSGEAIEQLRLLRGEGFDPHVTRVMWSFVLAMAAEVASANDAHEIAAEIGERLEPLAGHIAGAATQWCSIDFARATLALAAGEHARAVSIAHEAVATSRARHTPLLLGRELILLADARRATGDAESAVAPLVDEAFAIADRTGALLIRHDAERRGLIPAEH